MKKHKVYLLALSFWFTILITLILLNGCSPDASLGIVCTKTATVPGEPNNYTYTFGIEVRTKYQPGCRWYEVSRQFWSYVNTGDVVEIDENNIIRIVRRSYE